ncbi:ead/Ea22-like family protein [Escherichia coli]|uniref:ead/Ea22-like family protein n=1 Tax=Escherichia coli TaxID=562 RepID=UPI003EBFAF66
MSNIDKQALREMAERAASDSWGYDRDEFNDAITPEVVLALLDELEAKDKRIADYHDLISGLVGVSSSILREVEHINNAAAAGKGE